MIAHYIDLSLRSFRRTPLISVLMVLAIAIGIGVTMTSLSVYHMMSMDPLPEKSSVAYHPQLNTMDDGQAYWTSDDLPLQLTYKDTMFLYNSELDVPKAPSIRTGFSVQLDKPDFKPMMESARATSKEFFSIFNMSFKFGGHWSQGQQDDAAFVTAISTGLNQTLFDGENSVGEQIIFNGKQYTVVGVFNTIESHIKYYDLNNGAFNDAEDIFIPFTLIAALELNNWGNTNGWRYEEVNTFEDKLNAEFFWWQFWMQLNDDDEVQATHKFIQNYLEEQASKGRFERESAHFALRDMSEWLEYRNVVSEDNRILVVLSFMFLAVCLANILGLLLGKFLQRVSEVGVRRALGASKRQVFLQHLVEVSILGLLGGILGVGLAQLGLWGVRATYSYYSNLATMDWSMLLAAPVIAILACILAGLYPAWVVCKTNPAICLKTQ